MTTENIYKDSKIFNNNEAISGKDYSFTKDFIATFTFQPRDSSLFFIYRIYPMSLSWTGQSTKVLRKVFPDRPNIFCSEYSDISKNFIIECEGLVCAALTCNITRTSASLSFLGVLEDHRGRHLGENLLKSLIQELSRDDSNKVIKLTVKEANIPAVLLYEKMGFTTVHVVPNLYANLTGLVMERIIRITDVCILDSLNMMSDFFSQRTETIVIPQTETTIDLSAKEKNIEIELKFNSKFDWVCGCNKVVEIGSSKCDECNVFSPWNLDPVSYQLKLTRGPNLGISHEDYSKNSMIKIQLKPHLVQASLTSVDTLSGTVQGIDTVPTQHAMTKEDMIEEQRIQLLKITNRNFMMTAYPSDYWHSNIRDDLDLFESLSDSLKENINSYSFVLPKMSQSLCSLEHKKRSVIGNVKIKTKSSRFCSELIYILDLKKSWRHDFKRVLDQKTYETIYNIKSNPLMSKFRYLSTSGAKRDCSFRSVLSSVFNLDDLNRIDFDDLRTYFGFKLFEDIENDFLGYLSMKLGHSLYIKSSNITYIFHFGTKYINIHHSSSHFSVIHDILDEASLQWKEEISQFSGDYISLIYYKSLDKKLSHSILNVNFPYRNRIEIQRYPIIRLRLRQPSPDPGYLKFINDCNIKKFKLLELISYPDDFYSFRDKVDIKSLSNFISLQSMQNKQRTNFKLVMDQLSSFNLFDNLLDSMILHQKEQDGIRNAIRLVHKEKQELRLVKSRHAEVMTQLILNVSPKNSFQNHLGYIISSHFKNRESRTSDDIAKSLMSIRSINRKLAERFESTFHKPIQNMSEIKSGILSGLKNNVLFEKMKIKILEFEFNEHLAQYQDNVILFTPPLQTLIKLSYFSLEDEPLKNQMKVNSILVSTKNAKQDDDFSMIFRVDPNFSEEHKEQMDHNLRRPHLTPIMPTRFNDGPNNYLNNKTTSSNGKTMLGSVKSTWPERYGLYQLSFKRHIIGSYRKHLNRENRQKLVRSLRSSKRITLNSFDSRNPFIEQLNIVVEDTITIQDSSSCIQYSEDFNNMSKISRILSVMPSDLLREIWSSIFYKLADCRVKKGVAIADMDFLSDRISSIEGNDETLNLSFECMLLLVEFVYQFSSIYSMSIGENKDIKMFPGSDVVLSFITGTILKLRVALISNVYMSIYNMNTKSDIEFSRYFPGMSNRTPDYINIKNSNQQFNNVTIIETSYSSHRAKGIIAKGLTLNTSKYYEEMYHLKKMGHNVDYVPLIFFDKMINRVDHYFEEYRIINSIIRSTNIKENIFSYNAQDITNEIKVKKFNNDNVKQNLFDNGCTKISLLSNSFIIRNCSKFIMSLRLTFLMNNQIYPRGKMLNKSISTLHSLTIYNNDFLKYSYVIEYNYYLLIHLIPELVIIDKLVLDFCIGKKQFNKLDEISLMSLSVKFRQAQNTRFENENSKRLVYFFRKFNHQYFTNNDKIRLDFIKYISKTDIKEIYDDITEINDGMFDQLNKRKHLLFKPDKDYIKKTPTNQVIFDLPNVIDRVSWKDISSDKLQFSVSSKDEIARKRELITLSCPIWLASSTFIIRGVPENSYFTCTERFEGILFENDEDLFTCIKKYPSILVAIDDGLKYRFKDKDTLNTSIEEFNSELINNSHKPVKSREIDGGVSVWNPLTGRNVQITFSNKNLKISYRSSNYDIVPLDISGIINKYKDDVKIEIPDMKLSILQFDKLFSNENLPDNLIEEFIPTKSLKESQDYYINIIEGSKSKTSRSAYLDDTRLKQHVEKNRCSGNENQWDRHCIKTGIHNFSDTRLTVTELTKNLFSSDESSSTLRSLFDRSFKSKVNIRPYTIVDGNIYFSKDTSFKNVLVFEDHSENILRKLKGCRFDPSGLLKQTVDKCNAKRVSREKLRIEKLSMEELNSLEPDDNNIGWNEIGIQLFEKNLREESNYHSVNKSDFNYEFIDIMNRITSLNDNISYKSNLEFNDFKDDIMNNELIYSMYCESVLINAVCMNEPFRKDKKGLYRIVDSGFKNKFAIMTPKKKNIVSYMICSYGKYNKESKYKNTLDDYTGNTDQLLMTNMYTEDISHCHYKSHLFYEIIQIGLMLYNMRCYTNPNIILYMNMLYQLMWSFTKQSKLLTSVFKFLNVIQFSDFSNIEELMQKYVYKEHYKNKIQLCFARRLISDYNKNLHVVKKFTEDNLGNLVSVRGENPDFSNKIRSMCGFTKSIDTYIMTNTLYTYVFKSTTKIDNEYHKFISTIENNNHMTASNNDPQSLKEDARPCFFDKDIIHHSIKLLKENLTTKNPELISGKFFSDKICDDLKKNLNDDWSQLFFSARKSLMFKMECAKVKTTTKNFISDSGIKVKRDKKTANIKQTVYRSTLDLLDFIINSDTTKESSEKNMSPELFVNKFLSYVSNPDNIEFLRKYSNLAVVGKKDQPEESREIYIVHIIMKLLLYIIQSVFRTINLYIDSEMVVRSVGSKLAEIKKMSKKVLTSPKDFEIIYMNGDMASWSGTDMFDKFFSVTKSFCQIFELNSNIDKLLTICLLLTRKMKVIIPPSVDLGRVKKSVELEINGEFRYVLYEDAWGQGLFHNISSFVHVLEQIWRKYCFTNHLKNIEDALKISIEYPALRKQEMLDSKVPREECELVFGRKNRYHLYDLISCTGFESDEYIRDKIEKLNSSDKLTSLGYVELKTILGFRPNRADYDFGDTPESILSLRDYSNYSLEQESDVLRKINIDIFSKNSSLLWILLQIVHSDDKNEVVVLKMKYYELFVKFSDIGPFFFSLKPSKTKNSFSRLISEMVGLQNILGRLFDNPIKVISGLLTTMTGPDFFSNYLAGLSRINDFYRKSCNELMCYNLNRMLYSNLIIRYGLREVPIGQLSLLPISSGGVYLSNFKNLHSYGWFADFVTKRIIYGQTSQSYSYLKILLESKKLNNFHSKMMKSKLEKFSQDYSFNNEDSIDPSNLFEFDCTLPSGRYKRNIIESIISRRKEMFEDHNIERNIINVLQYKKFDYTLNENIGKTKFGEYIDDLLGLMQVGSNDVSADHYLIFIPDNIVNKICENHCIEITDTKIDQDLFFDLKGFNIKKQVEKNEDYILDYSMSIKLSENKLDQVFNSYKNRRRIGSIVNKYEYMVSLLGIKNSQDLIDKRNIIDMITFMQMSKKDYIFKTDDPFKRDFNYYTYLSENKKENISINLASSRFGKLNPKFSQETSIVTGLIDTIKKSVNLYLYSSNTDYLEEIKNEVLNSGMPVHRILSIVKQNENKEFSAILNFILGSAEAKFKFDPTLRIKLTTRKIYDSEAVSIYLLLSENTVVDFIVCEKDVYTILMNEYIERSHIYRIVHNKHIQRPTVLYLNNIISHINQLGYDVSLSSLKNIRKNITVEEMRSLIRINPVFSSTEPAILSKNYVIEYNNGYRMKTKLNYYMDHDSFNKVISTRTYVSRSEKEYTMVPCMDKSNNDPLYQISCRKTIKYSNGQIKELGYRFKKHLLSVIHVSDKSVYEKILVSSIDPLTQNRDLTSIHNVSMTYIYLNKICTNQQTFPRYGYVENIFLNTMCSQSEMDMIRDLSDPETMRNVPSITRFNLCNVFDLFPSNGMHLRVDVEIEKERDALYTLCDALHTIIKFSDDDNDKKVMVSFYNSLYGVYSSSMAFVNAKLIHLSEKSEYLYNSVRSWLKSTDEVITYRHGILRILSHIHVDQLEEYRYIQKEIDVNKLYYLEQDDSIMHNDVEFFKSIVQENIDIEISKSEKRHSALQKETSMQIEEKQKEIRDANHKINMIGSDLKYNENLVTELDTKTFEQNRKIISLTSNVEAYSEEIRILKAQSFNMELKLKNEKLEKILLAEKIKLIEMEKDEEKLKADSLLEEVEKLKEKIEEKSKKVEKRKEELKESDSKYKKMKKKFKTLDKDINDAKKNMEYQKKKDDEKLNKLDKTCQDLIRANELLKLNLDDSHSQTSSINDELSLMRKKLQEQQNLNEVKQTELDKKYKSLSYDHSKCESIIQNLKNDVSLYIDKLKSESSETIRLKLELDNVMKLNEEKIKEVEEVHKKIQMDLIVRRADDQLTTEKNDKQISIFVRIPVELSIKYNTEMLIKKLSENDINLKFNKEIMGDHYDFNIVKILFEYRNVIIKTDLNPMLNDYGINLYLFSGGHRTLFNAMKAILNRDTNPEIQEIFDLALAYGKDHNIGINQFSKIVYKRFMNNKRMIKVKNNKFIDSITNEFIDREILLPNDIQSFINQYGLDFFDIEQLTKVTKTMKMGIRSIIVFNARDGFIDYLGSYKFLNVAGTYDLCLRRSAYSSSEVFVYSRINVVIMSNRIREMDLKSRKEFNFKGRHKLFKAKFADKAGIYVSRKTEVIFTPISYCLLSECAELDGEKEPNIAVDPDFVKPKKVIIPRIHSRSSHRYCMSLIDTIEDQTKKDATINLYNSLYTEKDESLRLAVKNKIFTNIAIRNRGSMKNHLDNFSFGEKDEFDAKTDKAIKQNDDDYERGLGIYADPNIKERLSKIESTPKVHKTEEISLKELINLVQRDGKIKDALMKKSVKECSINEVKVKRLLVNKSLMLRFEDMNWMIHKDEDNIMIHDEFVIFYNIRSSVYSDNEREIRQKKIKIRLENEEFIISYLNRTIGGVRYNPKIKIEEDKSINPEAFEVKLRIQLKGPQTIQELIDGCVKVSNSKYNFKSFMEEISIISNIKVKKDYFNIPTIMKFMPKLMIGFDILLSEDDKGVRYLEIVKYF